MKLLKNHKFITAWVLGDLFLFWILFYSGIVLPYINPSVEDYNAHITSFPRNAAQMYLWIVLHMPTSWIGIVLRLPDQLLAFSVIQTGVIAYFIEKARGGPDTVDEDL